MFTTNTNMTAKVGSYRILISFIFRCFFKFLQFFPFDTCCLRPMHIYFYIIIALSEVFQYVFKIILVKQIILNILQCLGR